jgi:hypothetical protein
VCVDFSHPTSSSSSPQKTVDEEVTFCCWCVSPRTIRTSSVKKKYTQERRRWITLAGWLWPKWFLIRPPPPRTTTTTSLLFRTQKQHPFFYYYYYFFFVFISFSFLLFFYSILILFRASMEKHERLSGLCLWLIRLFIYKIKVGIYTV